MAYITKVTLYCMSHSMSKIYSNVCITLQFTYCVRVHYLWFHCNTLSVILWLDLHYFVLHKQISNQIRPQKHNNLYSYNFDLWLLFIKDTRSYALHYHNWLSKQTWNIQRHFKYELKLPILFSSHSSHRIDWTSIYESILFERFNKVQWISWWI